MCCRQPALFLFLAVAWNLGCDGDPRAPKESGPAAVSVLAADTPTPLAEPSVAVDEVATDEVQPQTSAGTPRPRRAPLRLTGGEHNSHNPATARVDVVEPATVREALKPLQVIVGTWRGNTYRENVVHEADWAWDHTSQPGQPALRMTAPKNPFFHTARLSYHPNDEQYVLTVAEPDGSIRTLTGDFEQPPTDVPGDDGRTLQRSYKLLLRQIEPTEGEQWQVALNQQENNRFLIDLARRRGTSPFRKFDTVSEQRQGTSFALSDEGYGEKTCLISGGLGTIAVSHAGKTYWVCCTGCKAAFEDDPEKWIAEAQKPQLK